MESGQDIKYLLLIRMHMGGGASRVWSETGVTCVSKLEILNNRRCGSQLRNDILIQLITVGGSVLLAVSCRMTLLDVRIRNNAICISPHRWELLSWQI